MNKIVYLGFYGEKRERQQARYFTCGNTENCKMYQDGGCVCHPMIFSANMKCPHATYERDTGYSQYAKAYSAWKSRYKDRYNPLEWKSQRLAECGDYIFLPYSYLSVWDKKATEKLINERFIKKEDFTIETILEILRHRPCAIMGGEIKDYQNKEMPKFLTHLLEVFPEKYSELEKEHPEEIEKRKDRISNVGRKAFIATLKDGATCKDCHSNIWVKHGNEIVCEKWNTWLPFGDRMQKTRVAIAITTSMKTEVVSNDDADQNTQYYD